MRDSEVSGNPYEVGRSVEQRRVEEDNGHDMEHMKTQMDVIIKYMMGIILVKVNDVGSQGAMPRYDECEVELEEEGVLDQHSMIS